MRLAAKSPASTSRLPLLALALASFGIGTTEFVIMGLLPDVAGGLGVTIPHAGLLVTGYALSVAFGSPFLAVATARMYRRRGVAFADRHLHYRQPALRARSELCSVDGRANRNGALSRRILRTRRCRGSHIGAGAEEGTGDRNDVRRSYPRECAGRSVRHGARRGCRLAEYILGRGCHRLRCGICP